MQTQPQSSFVTIGGGDIIYLLSFTFLQQVLNSDLEVIVSTSREKQTNTGFCASSQRHMKWYCIVSIANVDINPRIKNYLLEIMIREL